MPGMVNAALASEDLVPDDAEAAWEFGAPTTRLADMRDEDFLRAPGEMEMLGGAYSSESAQPSLRRCPARCAFFSLVCAMFHSACNKKL